MHDLVIIGAGPAGLGAAIQAVHFGLDVLVLEREEIGGRLRYAREVVNFPGFKAAHPSGAALVKKLRAQAQQAGAQVVCQECALVDRRRTGFTVRTEIETHHGRSVIVATGVRPVGLSIPGADQSASRIHSNWIGIPVKRGKTIAVIGAGEVAIDQACSLTEHGAKVIVLARGENPRAFPGLVALARREGVRIRNDSPVLSIATANDGRLVLTTPGNRVKADFVLAAIGSVPCLPTITEGARTWLNRGLFLAGDANEMNDRQAVIAFGDGVQKAMRVYSILMDGKNAEDIEQDRTSRAGRGLPGSRPERP